MKQIMPKDTQTTLGALVIIVALSAFWFGKLPMEGLITILGLAGAWIGWRASDKKKEEESELKKFVDNSNLQGEQTPPNNGEGGQVQPKKPL